MSGHRFVLRVAERNYFIHDGQEWTVGRSPDCAIVLDDLLVSRRHAVFNLNPDGVSVRDLGSRNGILVNGSRALGETKLKHGDRVTVGSQDIQLKDQSRDQMKTWPNGAVDDLASPRADAATQSVSSVYQLLIQVCETAFSSRRMSDAQVAVTYLIGAIEENCQNRTPPDATILSKAADYILRLAISTLDSVWVDRLLDLYVTAQTMPDDDAIQSIGSLLPRFRDESGYSISHFIERMKERQWSTDDAARLKKLSRLERPSIS